MRIVHLQADNFKRLHAVEVEPDGNLITVGGKNGQGKSSLLDAIFVALKGRAAAPPKPIREGAEQCHIKLDLGELVVTRTFTLKEGKPYTDTVKVETSDGLRHGKPQQVLDALLGEIGFDPFEFVRLKAEKQAETLLEMVPLSVDLEEHARLDASDFQNRRDVNRDLAAKKAQRDGIAVEKLPEDAPDRTALLKALGAAADTNGAINSEKARRESEAARRDALFTMRDEKRARAENLRAEAANLDSEADDHNKDGVAVETALAELEPVGDYVDTDELRRQIADADALETARARQARRAELDAEVADLQKQSDDYTTAMEDREKARAAALREAEMPIEGLGFLITEAGKPQVTFGGVPFEQASTAEQLRASTAIAMAANPQLRVLRISDGSLLDEDSMAILQELADAEDFQLWVEVVGDDGSVGIVMDDGEVKEQRAAKPRGKAGKDAQ